MTLSPLLLLMLATLFRSRKLCMTLGGFCLRQGPGSSSQVTLNFSGRKRKLHTEPDIESHQVTERLPAKLTKGMILSQINSSYDPLGLAGPFTVRAKIMMRKLWIGEEDPVSDECKKTQKTLQKPETVYDLRRLLLTLRPFFEQPGHLPTKRRTITRPFWMN